MTPWDRKLMAATFALFALIGTTTAVVMHLSTPTGLNIVHGQLGLRPLLPWIGMISGWIVFFRAHTTGEIRALACLGANPDRSRAAIFAVTLLLSTVPSITLSAEDLRALYPARSTGLGLKHAHVPPAVDPRVDLQQINKSPPNRPGFIGERHLTLSDGGKQRLVFFQGDRLLVSEDRESPAITTQTLISGLPAHLAAFFVLSFLPCGLLWVATSQARLGTRVLICLAIVGCQITVFQLAGATFISPIWVVVPPLLIAVPAIATAARRANQIARIQQLVRE